ncbi:biotin transporter BioY, partial [Staphylococcus aureus]|nr:biotin transporter BioY [Staphylococcus aureus]
SVPIVLQNIGIFLAGVILGRKYGTLSVIVFLLLVVAGLPLLSGGRGGIGVFAGPSAGFLLLYPVVAFMIGAIRDRFINEINFWILFVGILVFGVIALDVIGTLIMGMIIN